MNLKESLIGIVPMGLLVVMVTIAFFKAETMVAEYEAKQEAAVAVTALRESAKTPARQLVVEKPGVPAQAPQPTVLLN